MMPAMPTSIADAKLAQAENLETEESRLDERIKNLTTRIVALQDESEARRLEMSRAYRERYSKRFADLDIKKALAGYEAYHDAKVFGAVYRLQPPNQALMLEVDRFGAKPDPADLGPVSAAERMVLGWLAGVGAEGEIRPLRATGLADRLRMIRKLPEQLLAKLADECGAIDSYLNVVLELELGNS